MYKLICFDRRFFVAHWQARSRCTSARCPTSGTNPPMSTYSFHATASRTRRTPSRSSRPWRRASTVCSWQRTSSLVRSWCRSCATALSTSSRWVRMTTHEHVHALSEALSNVAFARENTYFGAVSVRVLSVQVCAVKLWHSYVRLATPEYRLCTRLVGVMPHATVSTGNTYTVLPMDACVAALSHGKTFFTGAICSGYLPKTHLSARTGFRRFEDQLVQSLLAATRKEAVLVWVKHVQFCKPIISGHPCFDLVCPVSASRNQDGSRHCFECNVFSLLPFLFGLSVSSVFCPSCLGAVCPVFASRNHEAILVWVKHVYLTMRRPRGHPCFDLVCPFSTSRNQKEGRPTSAAVLACAQCVLYFICKSQPWRAHSFLDAACPVFVSRRHEDVLAWI